MYSFLSNSQHVLSSVPWGDGSEYDALRLPLRSRESREHGGPKWINTDMQTAGKHLICFSSQNDIGCMPGPPCQTKLVATFSVVASFKGTLLRSIVPFRCVDCTLRRWGSFNTICGTGGFTGRFCEKVKCQGPLKHSGVSWSIKRLVIANITLSLVFLGWRMVRWWLVDLVFLVGENVKVCIFCQEESWHVILQLWNWLINFDNLGVRFYIYK